MLASVTGMIDSNKERQDFLERENEESDKRME